MDRNPRRVVRAPRIMSKYYRAILELLVGPEGSRPPRAPVRLNKMARYRHCSALRLSSDAEDRPHHRRWNFGPLRQPFGWRMRITGCMSTRLRNKAGGRCRSYFDAATNLTIDNGNHLLLSGNRHALAYARSIGTEAGLVGTRSAHNFPFVDLGTGQRLATSTSETAGCRCGCSMRPAVCPTPACWITSH
jgi:hypothetical protein